MRVVTNTSKNVSQALERRNFNKLAQSAPPPRLFKTLCIDLNRFLDHLAEPSRSFPIPRIAMTSAEC